MLKSKNSSKNKTRRDINVNILHRNKLIELDNLKIENLSYKKELKQIENKLKNLLLKPISTYTSQDIMMKSSLEYSKKKIKKLIDDIDNNSAELEYFNNVHVILTEYSQLNNPTRSNLNNQKHFETTTCSTFYDDAYNPDEATENTETPNISPTISENTKKMKFDKLSLIDLKSRCSSADPIEMKISKGLSEIVKIIPDKNNPLEKKAKMTDEYIDIVHGCLNRKPVPNRACKTCGIEKQISPTENLFICYKCGESENIIDEYDKTTNGNSQLEKITYPYRRINHFNEWLSHFQVKENANIPDHIYEDVAKELYKQNITDFKILAKPYLKIRKVKGILKKLEYNKHYDHISNIITKLSGCPPPYIGRETEEKMRNMFQAIQEPYEKYKLPKRLNFLNYTYVVRKFAELLELDNLIYSFPLLKSKQKLRAHDKVWKKICGHMKWEYIPSSV